MFQRLFGRERARNRQIVEALYIEIVAAARRESLFSEWDVPDTPLGRFEMIALHMFLVQHRLRGETGVAREIAQDLIDGFFTEVEHSLRELGIGDMGVPKRMKKLARMYYGRTMTYEAALDSDDRDGLAAALTRNVRPDLADWPQAVNLADYAFAARGLLREQAVDTICSGSVVFPQPDAGDPLKSSEP
ncbi:ubiquinol-cytochrome C chaperone family protein [Mesorhizobium sp. LHD-90]|uniref:ubiquinol-cytochrome C chaperone family protein n=1 Tax=Mesorhizobium sp. LHD-90 TaxID=3071414 RepID=UPI0027DF676D|nr:ubiquinol-cytochrome C chaperone family protein [Mesorhizobium sp. LHD-90]MDQ6434554.1 ubiquinol-cytochrome C chaperone family protein [Mesorhizobium sp. LHD-90]